MVGGILFLVVTKSPDNGAFESIPGITCSLIGLVIGFWVGLFIALGGTKKRV